MVENIKELRETFAKRILEYLGRNSLNDKEFKQYCQNLYSKESNLRISPKLCVELKNSGVPFIEVVGILDMEEFDNLAENVIKKFDENMNSPFAYLSKKTMKDSNRIEFTILTLDREVATLVAIHDNDFSSFLDTLDRT